MKQIQFFMKQNLILLHAALGEKKQFNVLIPHLEANFKIFTLDFSGHGSNSSPHDFSIQQFTEDLFQLVKNHRITNYTLFGYSMGGYVALNFAANYPSSELKQIITYGTKFDWNDQFTELETSKLSPQNLLEKAPHFIEHLKSIHTKDWQELLQKTIQMMRNINKTTLAFEEKLKQNSVKTTIIRGQRDKMITSEESIHVAHLLQNATYLEIEDFSHDLLKNDMAYLANCISSIHAN